MRSLGNVGPGIDKPALFDGTGGNAATVSVRSAYFDLFRHIVYEVKQEHSSFTPQANAKPATSTSSLEAYLPLLETLATTMTPFLHHVTPSSSSEERLAISLTHGKSGSSPPRPAPAGPNPTNSDYQGWPGRTGRSSSCPSVVRTNARELTAPIASDQESISAVCAAVPVLGAVLGGQGDVLNPNAWDLGSTCKKTSVHHAAWRALGVVSMRLCSPAPAWVTNANGGGGGCFEPSQQAAGGRPGSSSKELDRHSASRDWWGAIQSTLRVVCDELVRARDCLEKLRQRSRAEGIILSATGAVRLFVGPVPFPLPVTWTCPKLPEVDGSEIHAVCFWVLGPTRTTVHEPGPGNDMPQGCRSAGVRSDTLECRSRGTVFTRRCKGSSEDQTACGDERYVGISLIRSSPCKKKAKPGGTNKDVGGFYVEIALGRRSRSKQTAGGTRTQGHEFDDRRDNVATVPTPDATAADGQGEEYQSAEDNIFCHGQESETETFLSEYPLPPGKWTHVCCTYLSTEGGSKSDGNGVSPNSTAAGVTIAFNGSIIAHRAYSSSVVGPTTETTTPTLGQAPTHSEPQLGDQRQRETSTKISNTLPASEHWEGTPVVCDVDWHPQKISPEQAHQMADNGVPTQREYAQCAAESYVSRLVVLAEKISASSQRVAATLSSPRWLSLWLKLISVTGHHSKRVIVRLIRPLLCIPTQPIGEDGEIVRESSKVQPCSPPVPLSTGKDFSDRSVVHRLCGLLGECMIPSILCHRSHRVPQACDEDSSTPMSSRIQQDPSILSEIVLLLRSLVEEAPNRWREHVFVALTDGLAAAARGGFSSLVKSAESQRGTEWDKDDQPLTWLGAATAAAYLGGGQVEGARLGARVVLLPRPGYAPAGTPPNANENSGGVKNFSGNDEGLLREMLSKTCMSADTTLVGEDAVNSMCRGTVVGWVSNDKETPTLQEGMIFVAIDEQYQDCLDETSDGSPALQGKSRKPSDDRGSTAEPRCRVVAVPAQHVIFQAETTEPATPFLFQQALPSVLAFLDPPPLSSARISSLSNDEIKSGGGVSKEIGAQLVAAHIRCRLLRALVVQVRNVEQAGAAARARILRPLLALGASPLASALVLALGADGAVAFGQRREFAPVVLSLRHQRAVSDSSLLSELESACQMVWSRLSVENGDQEERRPAEHVKDKGVGKCGSNCSRPTLQVLGGEALVEGNRVTACSHFPTICLSHVAVGLGSIGGRWYYEVTLLTGGLMQLGWAGPLFQCSPTRGQGVGDHMHSWAFDGFRQKRWCVSSASYGKRWRAGDVVGILLDAGLQEMRFR